MIGPGAAAGRGLSGTAHFGDHGADDPWRSEEPPALSTQRSKQLFPPTDPDQLLNTKSPSKRHGVCESLVYMMHRHVLTHARMHARMFTHTNHLFMSTQITNCKCIHIFIDFSGAHALS